MYVRHTAQLQPLSQYSVRLSPVSTCPQPLAVLFEGFAVNLPLLLQLVPHLSGGRLPKGPTPGRPRSLYVGSQPHQRS